ncbi:hypothetical protein XarbCFBP8138_02225 [Xanthomonas arboricola]|nr:hypothetical protein XarbCFBP8138_02225 [Xanthomonas arboricola]
MLVCVDECRDAANGTHTADRKEAITPHRRATCTAHIHARRAHNQPRTPTISTGPCPPTVAGPYAAWMPRKSLQERTRGVSCDGGRTRALQQGPSLSLYSRRIRTVRLPLKAMQSLSLSVASPLQANLAEGAMP